MLIKNCVGVLWCVSISHGSRPLESDERVSPRPVQLFIASPCGGPPALSDECFQLCIQRVLKSNLDVCRTIGTRSLIVWVLHLVPKMGVQTV